LNRVRLPKLILLVALVAGSAACAKARANTEPILMPDLLPPPPPPRIVETFPVEPLPTIAPSPVESALSTPPARPPEPPPAKPEPPKTEPVVVAPERPAPSAPSLTLKPGPGVQAQTEISIRAMLDRAVRDLHRVNYAALNQDGRTQYEAARRFMQQAEEALKGANLAFAGKLADKAATMASLLVR
jgi:type IV secretory pathway VirB10-like protein